MSPIYLSYFLDSDTPAYGGKTSCISVSYIKSIFDGDTSNDQKIEFPCHIGTHIDFPFHFSISGKKCNDYPASFWIFNKVGFVFVVVLDNIAKEVVEPFVFKFIVKPFKFVRGQPLTHGTVRAFTCRHILS